MTRPMISLFLLPWVAALACGGQPGNQAETASDPGAAAVSHNTPPDDDLHRLASEMPEDDVHSTAMREAMATAGHQSRLNRAVNLAPEIAAAWQHVIIRVDDRDTEASTSWHIPIGEPSALGETGLTINVELFIPDFIMDEGGITTRSAEPANPAARVVISEAGAEDYQGWLFAALPEIHPFSHPRYSVVLVEGVRAEE